MGRRSVINRHVDPEVFKDYIRSRNTTIRQLGSLCATNERTIRRMLKNEEVTLTIALDLCQYFDCDFNTLFGPDDRPAWKGSVETIVDRVN